MKYFVWGYLLMNLVGPMSLTSEESAMLKNQPRVELAFLPTPLHELSRTHKKINGPRLFIKRDDQTGLAFGGNKTRKLEYLLGDALEQKMDTIITAGALQSNHCRQTAAAAARLGLSAELLLKGSQPESVQGNLLLDHLLEAKIHWSEEEEAPQDLEELAERLRASGHHPYIIPYGGSNAIGALGYVNAMKELMEQQKNLQPSITHIVFATCSGGTHVGLLLGAEIFGFKGEILGISVDYDTQAKETYQQELVNLGNATAEKLGSHRIFKNEDFNVNYDYASGYAVVTEVEKEAIFTLAKLEGIFIDPVYTGRAFGALLDLIKKGYFTENDTVLFWHTGGTPALFTYATELSAGS